MNAAAKAFSHDLLDNDRFRLGSQAFGNEGWRLHRHECKQTRFHLNDLCASVCRPVALQCWADRHSHTPNAVHQTDWESLNQAMRSLSHGTQNGAVKLATGHLAVERMMAR